VTRPKIEKRLPPELSRFRRASNRDDIEIFKKYLNYNPETGIFTWKKIEAGYPGSKGYTEIKVGKVTVLAHRLAWAWMYGE
jgi:hypothetical protein